MFCTSDQNSTSKLPNATSRELAARKSDCFFCCRIWPGHTPANDANINVKHGRLERQPINGELGQMTTSKLEMFAW